MNWKFWKKKAEEPEVEIEEEEAFHGGPRLIFEINDGSKIFVGCSWPSPANEQEASNIINQYANMLFLLATGKLTPTIKQAVGGVNSDRVSAEMGRAIVIAFNNMLRQNGYTQNDEPLISAQEAFAVRGPQA